MLELDEAHSGLAHGQVTCFAFPKLWACWNEIENGSVIAAPAVFGYSGSTLAAVAVFQFREIVQIERYSEVYISRLSWLVR